MPIVIGSGSGTSTTDVTTYSGLITAIGNWLNRSDLENRIPEFIALLEARLNRILRVPEMEDATTLTAAATVSLPTDFLEARSLYLNTDPRQELSAVSLGTLRTKYAVQATGKPEVYAISDGAFVLGPAPDDTYSMPLAYYQRIPSLSTSNTTNWLSLKHPDVYLWGALTMAEAFLWNDERVPQWKAAWDEALEELIAHGNKKRYGAGPLRLRASVSE